MKTRTKQVLLTLLLTCSLVTFGKVIVDAVTPQNSNEGKISVNKTAKKDDTTYGRTANVKLSVTGTEFTTATALDVVLVLDRSGSMNGQKMIDTKNAAVQLATDLLANNTPEKTIVNMGIVTYGTNILNNYTTTTLSSNLKTITNLINDIPTRVESEGTNVQAGLAKANELLKNKDATNKVVILLTDGEPTFFIHDGEVKGNGSNDEAVCIEGSKWNCTKKRPSTAATEEATALKNDNTKIYTVGFDITKGSNADTFLQSVASTSDDAYLAKDKNELLKNFQDIVKSITMIAQNVKVEDIIPAGFTLKDEASLKEKYQDKIQITKNTDGTTKIIWTIGDLSVTDDLNLEYQVEADKDYYGSMYTNSRAVLTGSAVAGNPAYVDSNGSIREEFPKPVVAIPTVTENDTYQAKIGETLHVKAESILATDQDGLLENDHLITEKTDEEATIANKIIVEETANSCGNLRVNDDGSFDYTPHPSCYGKTVTFDYKVASIVTINGTDQQVISNTSTITITLEKDDAEITDPIISKTNQNGNTTTSITAPFAYEINYQTIIKNHLGDAKITIVDTLPYKIDINNSDLAGGIYNEANNTITWEETIADIDTYTNGDKIIDITKNISIVYQNIPDTETEIINKVNATIDVDKITKDKEDDDITIIKKGTIIINYVDTNNKKLAESITKNGLIDTEYTTSANDTIGNYQLVEAKLNETSLGKVNNYNGKYIDGTTTITYIYYESTGEIDQERTDITKEGTDKITASNNEVSYTINYHTIIDKYLGDATLTITDTLPYAIDVQKSDLAGGTYNEQNKTITWTIPYTNIDTYQFGAYEITFNKTIKVIYQNLDPQIREITNHVAGTITTAKTTDTKTDDKVTEVEIKGNVIAHYIDVDGNKLAEDVTTTELVGNDYNTTEKTFDGYVLVETKGDVQGKYIEGTIEVTYIYYQVTGDIDQDNTKITKTGTDEVDSIDAIFDYQIHYHTIIKDYIGDATITIVDTLPYTINEELSDLNGGIYDAATKTITWKENFDEIDTYTNGDKEITLTKQIKVVYNDLEATTREVINHVEGTIETTKSTDTTTADKITSVQVKGNVIAHYVDVNGVTIADDETTTGLVGNDYVTSEKEITDYILISKTNNTSGKYIDGTIEVTYTYYQITGTITDPTIEKTGGDKVTSSTGKFSYTINYHTTIEQYIGTVTIVIEDKLPYAIDVTKSDLAGGIYDPEALTITWTITNDVNTYESGNTEINFEKNLELVYQDLDPTLTEVTNKVSGTVTTSKTTDTKEDKTTTEVEIKGSVIVHYIDEAGNELSEKETLTGLVGEEYTTSLKEFAGYELIAIDGKTTGEYIEGEKEVTYIYTKFGKGGDVEVLPPQTGIETTANHSFFELIFGMMMSFILLIKKFI